MVRLRPLKSFFIPLVISSCLLIIIHPHRAQAGDDGTNRKDAQTSTPTSASNDEGQSSSTSLKNITNQTEPIPNENSKDLAPKTFKVNTFVDESDLVGLDAKYLTKDFDYVIRKISELLEKEESLNRFLNVAVQDLNLGSALAFLEQAAALGYDKAKLVLAKVYFYGDLVDIDMNRAYNIFFELSKKGYADANLYLGFMYSIGLGPIQSNQAKAYLHYTIAAVSNSTIAKMALGYRKWLGIATTSSCNAALKEYRRVAQVVEKTISFSSNIAIQKVHLVEEIENPGSSNNALDDDLIQYYQFLADKGDVNAQLGLGKLHYQGGYGVELDPYRAFHYFKLAADSGNTNAMTFLGKMYLEGNSVIEQDYEKAFKYFEMAAEKGNSVGQSGLGIMYLYGKGVQQNYKQAFKYFSQATLQGWVDGHLHIGLMYLNGFGVKQDYKTAIKYFTMASQAGHILGFYNLAEMHALGLGTMRSCSTAVELFKTVSEKGPWGVALMEAHNNYKNGRFDSAFVKYAVLSELGYEVAQSNAALLLDRNEISSMFPKEEIHSRAFMYWTRSAAQGYSASRVKLGDYYYYGYGTEVNYELAANQYRLASEQQNNPQALFNLGYMYESGLGLKQDIYLAKRYYDLAAVTSQDAQVPVALALIKLFFVYAIENMRNVNFTAILEGLVFESDMDLYLVALLVGVLSLLFYVRRQVQE